MKLTFEIPVVFINKLRNAKHILIDHTRLHYFLDLKPADLIPLRHAGLITPEAPVRVGRPRIDYALLAQEYRQRLESGECPSRAELARNLGVSRAWIWKVMRRGAGTDHVLS